MFGIMIAGVVVLGVGGVGLITGLVMAEASRCGLASDPHNPPCTASEEAHDTVKKAGVVVAASGCVVMLGGTGLIALGHLTATPTMSTMKTTPKPSWAMPSVALSPRGAALRWTF